MQALVSAGVVPYRYVDGELEFLLIKHTHGHWEFPKGKVDPGETIEQAAVRELHEEAGITAKLHTNFTDSLSYSFFDRISKQRIHKRIEFFVGEADSSVVTISHEHADALWLPYEEAVQQLTHKESKLLLTRAYNFLKKD